MAIIKDTLDQVDTALNNYVENVFLLVSGPLTTVLTSAGAVSLLFVAVNHIMNVRSVSYSTYLMWAVRYALILAFVGVWANFNALRKVIVDTPLQYAAASIAEVTTKTTKREKCGETKGPAGIVWRQKYCDVTVITTTPLLADPSSIYRVMDAFFDKIRNVSKDLVEEVTWRPKTYKYLLAALIFILVAIVFVATSLIALIMAKVGLALMFGLGPLAIGMLTFPQTRGYFESWLRLTVGFALVPMLTIALMSIVLSVANGVPTSGDDGFFKGHLSFLIISIAALVFMTQIPGLASTLAGTSLPAIGNAAAAGAVAGAGRLLSSPVRAPLNAATGLGERISGAKNAGAIAAVKGAGPAGVAFAAVRAISQSTAYRNGKQVTKSNQAGALAAAQKKYGRGGPSSTKPSSTNPSSANPSSGNNTPTKPPVKPTR